jgi:hypothetical protein
MSDVDTTLWEMVDSTQPISPAEMEAWLRRALATRSTRFGGLRLKVEPLPRAELPVRPLEGARPIPWELIPLPRFKCTFAMRRQPDDEGDVDVRASLASLPQSVQEALAEDWIVDGRVAWGHVEDGRSFDESDDGRLATCSFAIAIEPEG